MFPIQFGRTLRFENRVCTGQKEQSGLKTIEAVMHQRCLWVWSCLKEGGYTWLMKLHDLEVSDVSRLRKNWEHN